MPSEKDITFSRLSQFYASREPFRWPLEPLFKLPDDPAAQPNGGNK
jgi:hypothetical protein